MTTPAPKLHWTPDTGWLFEAHNSRPRHYAAAICTLATRELRRAALQQVPDIHQASTKAHVETAFTLRKRPQP